MRKNNNIVLVDVNSVSVNPNNPRFIKDHKFEKLVQSIKDFPQMLEIRPIVVDENYIILGGNQRYQACLALGKTEIPIIVADNLTADQKKEFLIKDNNSFGEWDMELLQLDFDEDLLNEWSVDVRFNPAQNEKINEDYENELEYETETEQDEIEDETLFNDTQYQKILEDIELSNISETDKQILRYYATTTLALNRKNIAKYAKNTDNKAFQDIYYSI